MRLGVAVIGPREILAKRFGDDTLKGVRRFKGPPRNIINRAYEHAPDDIVGQMTIERLDNEMDALERRPTPSEEERVSSTLVCADFLVVDAVRRNRSPRSKFPA